jgi:hypothetical protein
MIPCLLEVTRNNSDHNGQLYKDSITEKNDDDDNIDVPKSNESKDSNIFKESFIMKLNLFKGVCYR